TILLGSDDQGNAATRLDQFPMNIVFDRVYAHGTATGNVRRIFQANSRSFALIDSYVGDAHEVGADSQAVAAWNGPGPFKIVNNYLGGAGETVTLGGAASLAAELMPSALESRCNKFYKPLSWKGTQPAWSVKNLFELKQMKRALVDGNIFENNWLH